MTEEDKPIVAAADEYEPLTAGNFEAAIEVFKKDGDAYNKVEKPAAFEEGLDLYVKKAAAVEVEGGGETPADAAADAAAPPAAPPGEGGDADGGGGDKTDPAADEKAAQLKKSWIEVVKLYIKGEEWAPEQVKAAIKKDFGDKVSDEFINEMVDAALEPKKGGRRRTKRKDRKGSRKSRKGAKKGAKKSKRSAKQSKKGGRSSKNRRKHSHRRKH